MPPFLKVSMPPLSLGNRKRPYRFLNGPREGGRSNPMEKPFLSKSYFTNKEAGGQGTHQGEMCVTLVFVCLDPVRKSLSFDYGI